MTMTSLMAIAHPRPLDPGSDLWRLDIFYIHDIFDAYIIYILYPKQKSLPVTPPAKKRTAPVFISPDGEKFKQVLVRAGSRLPGAQAKQSKHNCSLSLSLLTYSNIFSARSI